jgi:peptidyl-prolyl cis-trans isomerase C
MNPYSVFKTLFCSLFVAFNVNATETVEKDEILAQRGKGIVTQTTFAARADMIPSDIRQASLRNGNRLRDVMNTMLLRAQLAADAREAGFDNEQIVIERMQLAADTELGEAWLQHFVQTQPDADYEQLAREYYLLHGDGMLTEETIDVSHILVSAEERSEEEAFELANDISRQLQQDPTQFDQLIEKYTDDPSASSNKGKFSKVKKGDMVKRFETTAFALQKDEISSPVKTAFGYHIIRLDKHNEAQAMSFEEVKPLLIDRERKQHQDRIRSDYLGSLSTLDVDMTEEALEEMVRRQFGEDYANSPEDDPEVE